jgi:MOSC domain-containing protein YiiM
MTADESLTRCVEHLCGVRRGSIPAGSDPMDEWLAGAGMKRAAVADPAGFTMAGRFLARYSHGWTVAFGVPPGPIFDPTGPPTAEGPILEACVLAPLELVVPERPPAPTGAGRVEAIAIAPAAEAPMRSVERAVAVAHRGLDGDRYASGEGTFSARAGTGRDLTLVELRALEEAAADGVPLAPVDARRNLVVSGIDLDALIGRRFRVGAVECRGARRCEPCAHLERITVPGALRGLVHRGGLRADILGSGEIKVGDEIVAIG